MTDLQGIFEYNGRIFDTIYRSSIGLPTYTHSSTATNNQYLKWLNEQENELLNTIIVDELDLYISDRHIPRPEDANRTLLE